MKLIRVGVSMRHLFIIGLSLVMLGVFEKPAEAGLFFRRGPIRRMLFGPFRRRPFPRMFRRPPCIGCMPRNFGPRNFCGPNVHGGRCGFNNFNRNFRNFNNGLFRDQFNPIFSPGNDPRFNPLLNGSGYIPSSFDDFRNRNLGRGLTPVSRLVEEPQSEFEKQFRTGVQPRLENIRAGVWSGQCEVENGRKAAFDLKLSDETVETVREGGLQFPQANQLSYLVRTNAEGNKLFVRVDSAQSPRFCVLERD